MGVLKITTHHGVDKNSKMAKLIGTGPYATAVGQTVPDGFVLYAKAGNDMRYSVKPVDEYSEAEAIKKRLETV